MKQRIWYADVLRIMAIVMVVLIHIVSKDAHRYEIDTMGWQWMTIINGISRICVPLLFMVSGMFFLNPEKKLEPKTMYTKYIWRLVRAFIVWSVIYVLFDRFKQPDVTIVEDVDRTILEIIQGYFHLWFLYRLTEIYVMVPLLRPLTKEKRLAIYFVLVSFVVGILIPTTNQFPVRSTDTVADNGLNVDITLGYAGYFMAGYLLSRYTLPKNWRRILYVLGILGFSVTVIGTMVKSIQEGAPYALFYEYLTPNVFFASLATFVFMKQIMQGIELPEKVEKAILHISKYSFGIYLVHVLVRNFIWELGINTTLFTPILSVPLLALLVGGVSYFIIWILMKIWDWTTQFVEGKSSKAT